MAVGTYVVLLAVATNFYILGEVNLNYNILSVIQRKLQICISRLTKKDEFNKIKIHCFPS